MYLFTDQLKKNQFLVILKLCSSTFPIFLLMLHVLTIQIIPTQSNFLESTELSIPSPNVLLPLKQLYTFEKLLKYLHFYNCLIFTFIELFLPILTMFILNVICCISQPLDQSAAPRTNIIKKLFSPSSSLEPSIASSDNSNVHLGTSKEKSFLTSPENTLTFPNLPTFNQSFKSDDCNPGSDPCSLEEEIQTNIVSPGEEYKNQNSHKTLKLTPTKQQSFYGWDLADTQVKQWSVKDVLKFLGKVGLKRYHSNFYENKIKGKDLVTLSEKQLREDLNMQEQDIRTMSVYIQLLKEKSQRQTKQKNLSRSFGGHRKPISLYKYHCNTYSCRKLLHMVKNPIMQEESEEENGQKYGRKQNMTTKDVYSSTNFSELLTN